MLPPKGELSHPAAKRRGVTQEITGRKATWWPTKGLKPAAMEVGSPPPVFGHLPLWGDLARGDRAFRERQLLAGAPLVGDVVNDHRAPQAADHARLEAV